MSLLSSAMPWVSNSCTADKNITVTGCVSHEPTCWSTVTVNTHEGWSNQCQIGSPSEILEQCQIRSRNRDPFNASTIKNQQPAQFYRRFLQNYILNHNHGGQAENYSINVPTDLHLVCEQLHLRPNLLQEILHV